MNIDSLICDIKKAIEHQSKTLQRSDISSLRIVLADGTENIFVEIIISKLHEDDEMDLNDIAKK